LPEDDDDDDDSDDFCESEYARCDEYDGLKCFGALVIRVDRMQRALDRYKSTLFFNTLIDTIHKKQNKRKINIRKIEKATHETF
jgi:hypothetical protein